MIKYILHFTHREDGDVQTFTIQSGQILKPKKGMDFSQIKFEVIEDNE